MKLCGKEKQNKMNLLTNLFLRNELKISFSSRRAKKKKIEKEKKKKKSTMPKPQKPLYHSGDPMAQECGVGWHGESRSISGGRNTKPGERLSDVYLQVNPGATAVQAPTFVLSV